MPLKVVHMKSFKQTKEGSRIQWIDQYRGILFFMVILIHTQLCPTWMRYFIDPIFLTGFFFLSGYLYKDRPIKKQLFAAFNSLLFPLLLYCIIISFISLINDFSLKEFIQSFYRTFILGGDLIWFIPCLLCIEVIYYVYSHFLKKDNIYKYLLLVISIVCYFLITGSIKHHLPWNIDTATWCLGYYLWGQIVKVNKMRISERYVIAFAVCWILAAVFLGINGWGGGNIDIHNNYITNQLGFLILSYGGCYIAIHLMPLIKTYFYFSKLGMYTLFAFAFHSYILRGIMKFVKIMNMESFYYEYSNLSMFIISFVTGLVILILGTFFNNYMPIILGKVKILK